MSAKSSNNRRARRAAAIVAVATCWDIVAHLLAPPLVYRDPSPLFVNKALFTPIITLALLVAFGALAAVFLRIEPTMSGSPQQKGLKFGIAFGGLWLLGILEMSLIFGSPLYVELCSGLADASAIILLGILLGRCFATASPARQRQRRRVAIVRLVAILLPWLALRYVGYLLLGLESACDTSPISTLVWTTTTGLWIGAMQLLLCPLPTAQRWWVFPVVVFGIDWALFTPFVLIFVSGPTPLSILARIVLDLVAVSLGTLIGKNILFEAWPAAGDRT